MAEILDGKSFSNKILDEIKDRCEREGLKPGLAVILVGDDPASAVYVKMKEKACNKLGFLSKKFKLPADTKEEELINLISDLNNDNEIDGILLQLPLPSHLDSKKMLELISPEKDVDGFHPVNAGKLFTGQKAFIPCTPRGIIELLKEYKIKMEGKNAVVLGRSNIVGKPMALLLLNENATVTICHSRTKNIAEIARSADILIAAIGKPYFVSGDFIKEGAVVVDVGVNRVDSPEEGEKLFDKNSEKLKKIEEKGYVLAGDVNFEQAKEKASFITPVPGGVGPLTIAMLMKNTLESHLRRRGK
ncbi:methylenetetrahydrofolate dehydrogenase (NADP+) / methenyltetrahydrofolate cyclohydrolase [Thermotomaculum hydrothermale]|uniref:Bifunctional protein FolD n=1 Tax=Thermotomaculum hydrothermale TaxID=981385 RepID=A0A7R6PMM8_9BACT|nr:bifunctional methylenetetrahydrofolate dehydrogenase/methenyltetrahydrofolate cyclohydrolase FolD [Thermotomaculum hydrothermale]BBB32363.1 methylenetetrahydrofolate dehydrogenase (NADP+) / methenyltetrahydrofolate cyclohydrolase [Thermotomaculum hydrothermale]